MGPLRLHSPGLMTRRIENLWELPLSNSTLTSLMPTARLLTHSRSSRAQDAFRTRKVSLVTPMRTGAELMVCHRLRCASAGTAMVANAKPIKMVCLLNITSSPG